MATATERLTLGNLYHRVEELKRGSRDEPECRIASDIYSFIQDARAIGLGGTLTKAEKLFSDLEDFLRVRYIMKTAPSRDNNFKGTPRPWSMV